MSRRVARQTGPAHRLLLHVTQESLGMAGYTGDGVRYYVPRGHIRRTGDGRLARAQHEPPGRLLRDGRPARLRPWPAEPLLRLGRPVPLGGHGLLVQRRGSRSGRVGSPGPQMRHGRRRRVSIVTGGADVGMCAGLGSGGILGAPCTGTACKTFSAAAGGYTRGEAVAVIVLKRLSDARRCGDVVHGVIRGIATNLSTGTSPNITRPSVAAQVSLLRQVLHESLRSPADVSYVELHGSGTQGGDRAEMEAVAAVFGSGNNRQHYGRRRTNNHLRAGSIKANIGHSEGAAGITAVVKALVVLRYNRVPPNVGLGIGGGGLTPRSRPWMICGLASTWRKMSS
ncbi:Putative beta-ketoacyl synthase, thiolase, polyketide synthase, beta-ketoacyl synthase [Colletotrichum destructivum]|uniref:Beta-ketoacyl synthase, thiolase, polyketide synthase, beta-ketoacyl synthase n=1 Tax=Colletotrichum destructivum TaxID=34406 RepID=A0AAX4IXV5_9PEZI|nr:Putative beta-ketoacyl synthase, thiolase, polyketide synthase, beta-ketoacyl synthase [Colletotrichum destructivum]